MNAIRHLPLALLTVLIPLGCGRMARSTCDTYESKRYIDIPDSALEACMKACEKLEHAPSCRRASSWLADRGDFDPAREFAKRACEFDEPQELGTCPALSLVNFTFETMAYNGELDELRERLQACKDNPAPCEQNCERGDIDACVQLGDMYALGLGVTGDPERAHALFSKACEAHDDGYYCWPHMSVYVNPESCQVPDNRPPCDEDADGACPGPPAPLKGCGDVSSQGDDMGPPEHLTLCNGQRACDEQLERECRLDLASCERACEAGDAARCRQLGLMHASGVGVPERHPAKAERYTKRACELGDTHSCEDQDENTRKLKPRKLGRPPD